MEMTKAIEDSFIQYAGAVLQSRALVDARDCLKPSARQIFYSMYRNKYIHNKPYEKTNAPVGDAMKDFYIHGNTSCVGIMMRAAQNFAMRYPLCEVKGNVGTLIESGNWASERYTSTRLSEISDYLFRDINKDAITIWRDNYADNLQYPSVLPSKGFYNIVNGTQGIGVAVSSSIPQFNLREVNEALIKLMWNPNSTFEELYCAPDFATGGIIINEDEVKESLKNGTGKACQIRSVIEYDKNDNCFVVTQIPYSVYTNTICNQLEEIINKEENPGIERFNDMTGITPYIKIYLKKKAIKEKILDYLFKNTSLQSWYGINLIMLDEGKYPKIFTWKEALETYLKHQYKVYTNVFQKEIHTLKERLEIVEGILIALASIEEVIEVIKNSNSAAEASKALCNRFLLTIKQSDAVLSIKLVKLAHLEIEKYEREKNDLLKEIARITNILNDNTLLKKEIEKDLRNVINKFGDKRRTQVFNYGNNSQEKMYYYTYDGKCYLNEPKEGYIVALPRNKEVCAITKNGLVYRSNDTPLRAKKIFPVDNDDTIINVVPYNESNYLIIIDNEKHFRCKEMSTLHLKRTTLSLNNITRAEVSQDKISKNDFKF